MHTNFLSWCLKRSLILFMCKAYRPISLSVRLNLYSSGGKFYLLQCYYPKFSNIIKMDYLYNSLSPFICSSAVKLLDFYVNWYLIIQYFYIMFYPRYFIQMQLYQDLKNNMSWRVLIKILQKLWVCIICLIFII